MKEKKIVTLPNDVLIPQIKKIIDEGHTVTFRVRGYSMRPFLEDRRDNVILSPCQGTVRRGDLLLVEDRASHYVLHRVIRVEGTTITLKGDGNVKGTETCQRSDVIAIATAFQRKGRTTIETTQGWKWRTYSYIWMNTQPLRRIILALHRRLFVHKP
ncbi:MAG: S24/S26 family peptidase [Alloprevotella sp.]|nr:S24/S26 family peptidase [Alloprevotella sp.]